ncbi:hypothetical protein BT96DRAFT_1002336 [Gymnopus androsaceus JB14]|uniref:Uncharacterized protein n=1 Tax=Gymnopus androsaceus JB14 TaxID=1447944 RepID=A0A6A4GY39_9AGAR|nr:hypothetical protein BT96DRAFT_1002336 [Gymnopus androsaceus JB14]
MAKLANFCPITAHRTLPSLRGSVTQKEAHFMHFLDLSEAETIEEEERKRRKEEERGIRPKSGHICEWRSRPTGGGSLAPRKSKPRALIDSETEGESGPVKGMDKEKENVATFDAGVDCIDVSDDDDLEKGPGRRKEGRESLSRIWRRGGRCNSFSSSSTYPESASVPPLSYLFHLLPSPPAALSDRSLRLFSKAQTS